MKTLYIECLMGAAGDMLAAALLELCPEPDTFIDTMNSLGLPGVRVSRRTVSKCGIQGTGFSVRMDGMEEREPREAQEHTQGHADHGDHGHGHDGMDGHHAEHHAGVKAHHHHSSPGDITAIIAALPVSDSVKTHAQAVYDLIAQAESAAHGVPVHDIHFHEVGTLDAIADIVGVCLLIEALAPEQIIVSPVHVGSGHVRTDHGVLPVPAPATAHILRGVPCYSEGVRGELCTPTGAALLKHFAGEFAEMPVMRTEKIGYGMGKKDFPSANCVRVFWGEALPGSEYRDTVVQLSCNLDDMTPEAIAFAAGLLMENGARDVFTVPIYMKKNRPACLLVCLCAPDRAQEMAVLMLRHTSTNGVRQSECCRYKLEPEYEIRQTPYGPVRVKISSGYGVTKTKPEYEDVSACAKAQGVPFEAVSAAAMREGIVKQS